MCSLPVSNPFLPASFLPSCLPASSLLPCHPIEDPASQSALFHPDGHGRQVDQGWAAVSGQPRDSALVGASGVLLHLRAGRCRSVRFGSTLLADGEAVLDCMLYVELNAVRAGLADTPEQWRDSSYRMRCRRRRPFPSLWRNMTRVPMLLKKNCEISEGIWSAQTRLTPHSRTFETRSLTKKFWWCSPKRLFASSFVLVNLKEN